jgi:hypothetical protein
MFSTGISGDTLSDPNDALCFLLDPIREQFAKHYDIIQVLQHISILGIRYEYKIQHATDVNWRKPFSTEFSLLESVQSNSPKDLAQSTTNDVWNLYLRISLAEVLNDGPRMRDLATHWSDLSDDTLGCLTADKGLVSYFLELAKVHSLPKYSIYY